MLRLEGVLSEQQRRRQKEEEEEVEPAQRRGDGVEDAQVGGGGAVVATRSSHSSTLRPADVGSAELVLTGLAADTRGDGIISQTDQSRRQAWAERHKTCRLATHC